MGGYAWFDLRWNADGIVANEVQAVETRDALIGILNALRDELQVETLILGGFSQGAMMSFGVAVAEPELLSALMLLSGRAVPDFVAAGKQLDRLPTLIQHGLYDEILAIDEGRKLRNEAVELGAEVQYGEYPMGHQISGESLADLNKWLLQRL
jgi:phospholipase/carboxylesterase